MRRRDYLLDRLPILAAFGLTIGLLLLVIQLGPAPIPPGDALYVLLLAAVVTSLILTIDLARQDRFRRAVQQQLEDCASSSPGEPGPLPEPGTREGRAFRRLLESRHRRYRSELREYQLRAEQHRTFVDAWAHQMKTPLAVLELTAQEARTAGSDGVSAASWESVEEELERLHNGFQLMLATARLERFDLDLRPSAVDVTALVRTVVNDLKRSFIRSRVYPRVEAAPGPTWVDSDVKWLDVVVRQVLANAIKYSALRSENTTDRLVWIRVTTEAHGTLLTIEDHGIGIPSHDLSRVFERFYTGDNGRISSASTGIGLFLVREICRNLGHDVEIASTQGHGTQVRFAFRQRGSQNAGDGFVRSRLDP